MSLKHLLAVSALAFALPQLAIAAEAPVPAGVYKVDPNHASIGWSIKHLGLSNYHARFAKFDAEVSVDQANPAASKLSFKLDPASVRTDYSGDYQATHKGSPFKTWEEAIAKGFLGADKTPQITFTSSAFKLDGENQGVVTGELTMNGVTKPVSFTVALTGAGEHPFAKKAAFGIAAAGVVKRSDFGVAQQLNAALGDEVAIEFNGEFLKQ